jgi:hypothetical protein
MLEIQESFVNATRGCRTGESDWYEPYTDDRGKLFRSLVKEHGRCIGKVYIDRRTPVAGDALLAAYETDAIPVGWVFLKRTAYDRSQQTFLLETWVTVRDKRAA